MTDLNQRRGDLPGGDRPDHRAAQHHLPLPPALHRGPRQEPQGLQGALPGRAGSASARARAGSSRAGRRQVRARPAMVERSWSGRASSSRARSRCVPRQPSSSSPGSAPSPATPRACWPGAEADDAGLDEIREKYGLNDPPAPSSTSAGSATRCAATSACRSAPGSPWPARWRRSCRSPSSSRCSRSWSRWPSPSRPGVVAAVQAQHRVGRAR